MRLAARLKAAFALVMLGVSVMSVTVLSAQSPLTVNTPVEGTVSENADQRWTFQSFLGGVWSFVVEGQDGFDPVIALSDTSGRILTGNDDYDYPNTRDALLEAVTLNRTDTYTLRVSGFERTGGNYRLTMLPGFARLLAQDDFSSGADWQSTDTNLTAAAEDGRLNMVAQGTPPNAGRTTFAAHTTLDPVRDFYMGARVMSVTNPSGWIVGAAFRQVGSSHYLIEFSHQGLWRFSVIQSGAARVLRDWTPHPAIVAGTTQFSFGVLARGTGFDVFYNGAFIGDVNDNTIPDAGRIGLAVGTVSVLESRTTAQFDDVIITVPFNEDITPIIPSQVIISDATNMTQALKRNHVVSASGTLALTVPNVTVEFARAGVNRQMVGQATRYTNFALGATVELNPASVGVAGCGLIVRQINENNYTLAYLDSTGGYGISQRQADEFAPGLFGVDERFLETPTNGGRHHLLLIADRNTLYFYIDGQFVGTAESNPQAGEVGAAVVNFDNVIMTCQFDDLWLWRW